MAIIAAVRTEGEGRTLRITWSGLAGGDSGEPVSIPGASDKTVQISGTFGTSTVSIQGSLDVSDAGVYNNLTDPQGNAIAGIAAAAIESITENTTWVKPVVAAGTGTPIKIVLLCRSTM